ncbi:McrC family protein [Mucilaginibacter daejeonensis]|uniref:McrC family protein n=1 Tax=Mucilaginibacter daejeonensis TaxID=398049 RepID=UPI001D173587|nr:McrC family protein [Mucilaginibacter daejeonensis]UEG55036.1 McrC family protein [Mucilaginibacter daejeonensis]
MILHFFEYDKVPYSRFSPAQVIAIRRLHTLTDGLYYSLGDNSLTFKEHVGVIQINELTIEVLPKIDRDDIDGRKWHDILLQMLKECHFVDPHSAGNANLKLRANSVLELYFEKYIAELETLLHRGLTKKYRSEEGQQYALKGRLLFERHLLENSCHAERFFVAYDEYDRHHPLHQLLRQGLETVCRLTGGGRLADRSAQLLAQWPESKRLPVDEQLFKRFSLNRKTQPYQEALKIARMILLNYHPDLRGGRESVLALMFNMNDLWEEFVFRRLKSCERQFGWKISEQRRLKYWTNGSGGKLLIPDILVELPDGRKMVIDTKWKRPARHKPDDQDLRQLLAYKLYYEGGAAYLLYPASAESYKIEGHYHPTSYRSGNLIFRETFELRGGLLFLNLLNGRQLLTRKEFREMVAGLLTGAPTSL